MTSYQESIINASVAVSRLAAKKLVEAQECKEVCPLQKTLANDARQLLMAAIQLSDEIQTF